MKRAPQKIVPPEGMKRFVFRDERGRAQAAYAANDMRHAIEQFLFPARNWQMFQLAGWICREEPA